MYAMMRKKGRKHGDGMKKKNARKIHRKSERHQ